MFGLSNREFGMVANQATADGVIPCYCIELAYMAWMIDQTQVIWILMLAPSHSRENP